MDISEYAASITTAEEDRCCDEMDGFVRDLGLAPCTITKSILMAGFELGCVATLRRVAAHVDLKTITQ